MRGGGQSLNFGPENNWAAHDWSPFSGCGCRVFLATVLFRCIMNNRDTVCKMLPGAQHHIRRTATLGQHAHPQATV
jgi:hypothetical protein